VAVYVALAGGGHGNLHFHRNALPHAPLALPSLRLMRRTVSFRDREGNEKMGFHQGCVRISLHHSSNPNNRKPATTHMSRVSTYLNFPRSTEEAFEFYKSVFKSEYCMPIARFDSAPANPDHPLRDADKKLVLHVELPILGGHILMGTDAPESMGFTVAQGNNVIINLEPDTRAETDRLFAELSQGGKVDMPLQDMFWGAYFGSLADRFGIYWMFNCMSKI
jgi:PhnB protein